ncbi:hypothetical protein CR513_19651, partial [Mucuna pruriens]
MDGHDQGVQEGMKDISIIALEGPMTTGRLKRIQEEVQHKLTTLKGKEEAQKGLVLYQLSTAIWAMYRAGKALSLLHFHATSKDVSAQKKRLGPGGTVLAKLIPSQPSPASRPNPLQQECVAHIDVHTGTLSMEFGDNLVQFNIFEAMKHPTKDHSLFSIDVIDELVAKHLQLEADNAEFPNFVEDIDVIGCLGSVTNEFDYDKLWEV